MRGRGGARAKARVHTHQVELEVCSGAEVQNADAEGRCLHRQVGGKQQAGVIENQELAGGKQGGRVGKGLVSNERERTRSCE
jgi:hypothetical protein